MCQKISAKAGCGKTSCECGGAGAGSRSFPRRTGVVLGEVCTLLVRAKSGKMPDLTGWKPVPPAPDPRAILAMKFGESQCGCGGGTCPRHYLAYTGFMLAGFLVLHLALNALALWPQKFQAAVSRNHSLGALLPVLEVALIFIPLAIHAGFGLRTLRREKLKFGVAKHHHGSDLRQWLQRVTAVILLGFIAFHVAVFHRGLGGRFDAEHAFASVSQAVWQFWPGLPVGHPLNLLVAQIYLMGVVAAVYHMANGLATGAEVLGLVQRTEAQERLWRVCVITAPVLLLAGLAAWYAFAGN